MKYNSKILGLIPLLEILLITSGCFTAPVFNRSFSVKLGLSELGKHCEVKERVSSGLNKRESIIKFLDKVQIEPYRDTSTSIAEGVYKIPKILKRELNFRKIFLVNNDERNYTDNNNFFLFKCDTIISLKQKKLAFCLRLVRYGKDTLVNEKLKFITTLSNEVYEMTTPYELGSSTQDQMPTNNCSSSLDLFSQISKILQILTEFCMKFQTAITALIALIDYLSSIFRKLKPSKPDKFW